MHEEKGGCFLARMKTDEKLDAEDAGKSEGTEKEKGFNSKALRHE
jgi:hypothetical protein